MGGRLKRKGVYVCVCIYIYIYIYVCMYMCLYIVMADSGCCITETNTTI